MSVKKVYFIRHGETEGNLGKYFQFPETVLSELGHKGAKAVAERFRNLQVDELIASPFVRAQQTAGYVSEVVNLPVVTFEAFHECLQPLVMRGKRFDSEEGKAHIDTYKENYINAFWRPEGAENYFDLLQRVEKCVQMLEQSEKENIVVVSHGAFLRDLTAYLLLNKNTEVESNTAISFSLKTMSNVGITEFLFEEGKWKLFTWNDHAHFAE